MLTYGKRLKMLLSSRPPPQTTPPNAGFALLTHFRHQTHNGYRVITVFGKRKSSEVRSPPNPLKGDSTPNPLQRGLLDMGSRYQ